MNNEKIVLESIAVIQRILTKIIEGEKVSKGELQNLDKISTKINHLIEEGKSSNESTTSIEVEVTKYLENLGIPKNIAGYKYLRYAILLKYTKGDEMKRFNSQLYPAIACEFHTTSSRVERAIRHAIESSWKNGYLEKDDELFGHLFFLKEKKPSNSEFIESIVDHMKMKHLQS